MSTFIQQASQFQDALTSKDCELISNIEADFQNLFPLFEQQSHHHNQTQELVLAYNNLGKKMKAALKAEPNIHVYGFETPSLVHAEASRLIARLRDKNTERPEFVYSIQRAYEMLFHFAFNLHRKQEKHHLLVETPVTQPVVNWAVHNIPNLDAELSHSVVCVLLRGALLPSLIMSKEIQEHTTNKYSTPFALFRVKRNEEKMANNMEYILDLKRSFFNLEDLHKKDLIFADPMNATGGSLVTVVEFLRKQCVHFSSVSSFHVITSFKGALQTVRSIPEARLYTLWLDPYLNQAAYILPGLGDAGDRLNGRDSATNPRNILQLLAGFGPSMMDLYRSQVAALEKVVLG